MRHSGVRLAFSCLNIRGAADVCDGCKPDVEGLHCWALGFRGLYRLSGLGKQAYRFLVSHKVHSYTTYCLKSAGGVWFFCLLRQHFQMHPSLHAYQRSQQNASHLRQQWLHAVPDLPRKRLGRRWSKIHRTRRSDRSHKPPVS